MGYLVSITRTDESTRIFDLKGIVSKRTRRLLWGGGFITSSSSEKTEERIQWILDKNSAFDLFNSVEDSISTREKGNQIVGTLPSSYKGEPFVRLDFIDMEQSRILYSQNGEIIFARTTKELIEYGDASFKIIQVWTLKKMITQVNMIDAFGTPTEISVGEFNSKVPDFLREPAEWDYSELGVIPLFNFTNTPSISGSDESDLKPVEYLQNLVDATTQAVFKEIRNNSTRVISHGTNNKNIRNADGSINYDALNSDLFTSLGKQKNIDPNNAKALIEILQGDPKLESYGNFISWAIDMSLTFAGLASQGDSDANRTSAGTIFTKTGDVETTRFKRQLREDSLKKLLALIIAVDKRWNFIEYDDEEVSITIKENKVFDDQFKLDKLNVGSQLGLYTIEEMISLLKDTDDEAFIQENMKALEEQRAMLETMKPQQQGAQQDGNKQN